MTPNVEEIVNLVREQGESIKQHQTAQAERLKTVEKELSDLLMAQNRPGAKGIIVRDAESKTEPDFFVEVGSERLPVLQKSASLADFYRGNKGFSDDGFSIGAFVRDVLTGRKAASSTALVPSGVSASVIDDIRARTTVVQAGAGTIPIDGPTVLARIAGDPTVHQHTENANDITASDIDLAPVTLNPKALVAIIPLSMEVVADSPNLDRVLRTSLSAAFAAKLDALALATILADTAIPDSAAGQDPAIWAKCLEAIAAALAANQPVPTAMICNTADFIARASQLASTAGSWLGKPPVLSGMGEYPTTAVTAGLAIYGGFERAFAIAMRQELMLEIVRFGDAGRGQHKLIAHMRGDGVVLQPKGLFIQRKTV